MAQINRVAGMRNATGNLFIASTNDVIFSFVDGLCSEKMDS